MSTTSDRRTRPRWGLALAAGVLLLMAVAQAAPAAAAPDQPGQPTSGYGSAEGYLPGNAGITSIGQVQTVLNPGGATDGSRVWVFRPPVLRDGASAPVVVYLHGFALISPDIYADHVLHLVRQGLIVVHPQYNLGGLLFPFDTSQSNMLDRAIAATDDAITWLGAAAGPRHLFGHSLGGLMGAAWTHRGGPSLDSLVLANPSTASPPIGTGLSWPSMAPATTARTVLLTGEDDTIAAPSQSDALFEAMPNAASRIVYEAKTDRHGEPSSQDLVADHSAPAQDYGFIDGGIADLFGGPATLDSLDSRFYWAALDATIDGRSTVPFAMGQWSDGTPVRSPVVRRQDVPPPPAAPSAPTDLVATAGDEVVQLTWSPPADDGGAPVEAYLVYVDGALEQRTSDASSTSATVAGLTNGTAYTIEVAAENGVGEGPRASTTATPEYVAPDTTTFPDVPRGHPFFVEVEWLADRGITGGYDDGGFRPGAAVTRQAMAAFLQRLQAGTTDPLPSSATFGDVGPGHPFFAEVEWAAAEGLMDGYPDGTFRPGATVTRQAMAAFLHRLAQPSFVPPGTPTFPDVGPSHPFFLEVEWLASTGITTGYDDGTFRPAAAVTRQSTAAFLYRFERLGD